MPSLPSVLANIPGYGGYAARRAQIEEGDSREIQQAGVLQQLLMRQQEQQKVQQFQQEVSQAKTPEERLAVAQRYMGADKLGTSIQSSQDRAATLEAANINRSATRDQTAALQSERISAQAEAARVRAEDNTRTEQQRAADRRELVQLTASLRQAPVEQPPVAVIGPDGKPILVSRNDALGKQPAASAAEKLLPPSLQKQLTEAAELADATSRFKTTFKDAYGGKTLTGDLGNVTGRMFGDETGQSQWWQDYELHQSQVRNKLFGSALTAPEIEAWNKSAINPRMNAGQIRLNLGRRDALEQRAINRLIKGATAGRYSREQIEAFTGRSADAAPTSPPQESSGKIVNFSDLK